MIQLSCQIKLYQKIFDFFVDTSCVFHFFLKGPGIFYGKIDVTGQGGMDSVTMDTKLISYPLFK